MKKSFLFPALLLSCLPVSAQNVVSVGKGSYASYTPLNMCYSEDHTPGDYGWKGDKSRDMQTRKIYLTERENQPIPTNDWWTNLITEQYSGHLWSYPQMIQAQSKGLDIHYPSFWIADGTEMKSNTILTIGGNGFKPASAVAEHWHDWDVEFSMKDAGKEMYVTMAHGMPFTWIETKGFNPTLQLQKSGWTDTNYQDTDTKYYDAKHNEISGSATGDRFLMERGGDVYGIYVPKGSTITLGTRLATVNFPGSTDGYVVVAVLSKADDLEKMAEYALAVPRETKVTWKYTAQQGKMTTLWHVDADNLATGGKTSDVLQGFIPHQWRDTGFDCTLPFTGGTYGTPHGLLKMASGNDFEIDYKFYGMLPYWALPSAFDSQKTPYDETKMTEMLQRYADSGTFGTDTYWGGKGLTQMALYMMMAREMGKKEIFEQCRKRLKETLVNWLTYTPGEKSCFFARYDRWGAMVGYSTSYDSDTFNDHHFHYGYFTLAGALLALVDDDFRDNYGQMLRLVAKDYANWQREDKQYPLFRTFDPWAGHSFAGGMGDGNGNGQESSSEAMQSWGGIYLLGVALGDDEMRDAGIFGWLSEARGTADYWFDRHRDNIDYTKYKHPYNSNLTCHGVGYWTYFGYQNLYMQGIQWMPTSTALDYLSEDKDFALWDYNMLFEDPAKSDTQNASNGKWFDESFSNSYNNDRLDNAGDWGNVTLSYLQRSDPDEAARIFDMLWERDNSIAKTSATNGISYFSTHSHLTNGDLDWTITADIPTARVYKKGEVKVHIAYNPTDAPVTVTFSDGYMLENVPARQLAVEGKESKAVTDIVRKADPVDIRDSLLMPNLALHKPCTESGHENVGTLPEYATDGDDNTRWGSLHTDGQWIQVDLQQKVNLYQIKIHWEAAYASEYTVALSDDGENWTYTKDVTTSGGWDAVALDDRQARYIRITGKKRATSYGISLYEIQAFGKVAGASSDDIQGIRITADRDVLKQNEPSQISVKGYTNGGEWKDATAQFLSADGTVSADGVFTPSIYGTATINVKLDSSEDVYTKSFPVEEALYVRYVSVSPQSVLVVADGITPTEVAVETKDQFGGPFELQKGDMTYDFYEGVKDASGSFAGSTVSDSDIRYEEEQKAIFANKVGKYSMVAHVTGNASITDTIEVDVRNFVDMNLAYMKTATASSQIGDGSGPEKAVDGNTIGTRWESAWTSNDEWMQVDLEKTYTINKVVVYWENARAAEYDLQVSKDGETWQTVANVKDSPTGGETVTFSSINARFVRIQGISKAMPAYGYSIYELEVYGTGVASGMNSVNTMAASKDAVYDINGKKVRTSGINRKLQKGIYIIGNRKVQMK